MMSIWKIYENLIFSFNQIICSNFKPHLTMVFPWSFHGFSNCFRWYGTKAAAELETTAASMRLSSSMSKSAEVLFGFLEKQIMILIWCLHYVYVQYMMFFDDIFFYKSYIIDQMYHRHRWTPSYLCSDGNHGWYEVYANIQKPQKTARCLFCRVSTSFTMTDPVATAGQVMKQMNSLVRIPEMEAVARNKTST